MVDPSSGLSLDCERWPETFAVFRELETVELIGTKWVGLSNYMQLEFGLALQSVGCPPSFIL
eukprot:3515147-Rhodomonas_salina.1